MLLFTLLAAVLLPAQQRPTHASENFTRIDAIPYAQGKSAPLLADLFLPRATGLSPAIVYIHGGGWIHGQRSQGDLIIPLLAQHGYAGMAIDYDLSPAVRFPVALEQCKEAVRWLRAHAAQYHIDPNRIAVLGSSAGGELAALVALTPDDPRYEQGANRSVSSAVKAAILYSADLDLTKFSETDESILPYLGGSCSTHKDLCLQASPQFQLAGKLPPLFLGYGDADHDVPSTQSTAFLQAYRQANGTAATFIAEGGPHTYWVKTPWFQPNADATLIFLEKYL